MVKEFMAASYSVKTFLKTRMASNALLLDLPGRSSTPASSATFQNKNLIFLLEATQCLLHPYRVKPNSSLFFSGSVWFAPPLISPVIGTHWANSKIISLAWDGPISSLYMAEPFSFFRFHPSPQLSRASI